MKKKDLKKGEIEFSIERVLERELKLQRLSGLDKVELFN